MNTSVEFKEIRVIVGPKLNHVYVWVQTVKGERMVGVDGWHYKATTKPTVEFLTEAFTGKDDPLLWPQGAPPEPNDAFGRYERLE